jgi:carbamoyltransferase
MSKKTINVLGLHKDPWHNTGAALIRHQKEKTEFVFISEERLDRIKDSRNFPRLSIKACLKEFKLDSLNQVDLVVIDYIRNKDWRMDYFKTPCVLSSELDLLPSSKIHVMNHHLAHAAATFYSSGFEKSAVLVVDGRGSENETQSLFLADHTGIKYIDGTKKIGIGLLYSSVTQKIGFKLLQEGKTMGLAPYGADIKNPIFQFNGKFNGIETDYSDTCNEGSYSLKISHRPIVTFEDKARAAYDVQIECEAAIRHLALWAKEVTGMDHLCISGGVALNSVANYKILMSGLYKDVFINPAASDTGIPLGAALHGLHHILGIKRNYKGISPFLGPNYSKEQIFEAIDKYSGYRVLQNNVIDTISEMLADNKIIACHFGRSEMGPRALGNRSILMSPLRAENKDILNERVKHRESFRPFAPVILEEFTSQYFIMDRPCPFMLFVPQVRDEMKKVIPAVTHVDGSGRLQTINSTLNPFLHIILKRFAELTGVPVLLNTSFNDNNEPIVESPEDAIRCFMGTNIDALVFNGDTVLIKN